jgi:putative phosphoserine phosphatase/1-acylglycerol-3-phosphate O-acyltransferase
VYVCFTVLTLRKLTPYTFKYAAHGWGRVPLWLAGINLDIVGREHLDQVTPRVVVFNHQSMLDLFWLSSTFPARGVAIIKREFAFIPVIGIALWSGGFLFIDRKNRQGSIAAIKKVAARIRKERLSLFAAPEGTRSASGDILPFKKGPFYVALEQHLPVYPIVIHGPAQLLPKGKIIPAQGTIYMRCLPPIDTSEWTSANLSQKMAEVRALMIAEHEKIAQLPAIRIN